MYLDLYKILSVGAVLLIAHLFIKMMGHRHKSIERSRALDRELERVEHIKEKLRDRDNDHEVSIRRLQREATTALKDRIVLLEKLWAGSDNDCSCCRMSRLLVDAELDLLDPDRNQEED